MIFDTHSHYDDARFDEDREALLSRFPAEGIGGVMNAGATLKSSAAGAKLAGRYSFFRFSAGVHPDEVFELEALGREKAEAALSGLLEMPGAKAVGEIGLDYHGDFPEKPSRELQQKWFRFQLELARNRELPIIIHSRDAAQDTLQILKEEGGEKLSLVMHCFSYEPEYAKLCLKNGWYLGVGGVLTYKNSRKLKETVAMAPLSQLLLETDCPYLPPATHRGERNCSLYLPLVAEKIAEIKGISPAEVEEATWANALRFYRLPENFRAGS